MRFMIIIKATPESDKEGPLSDPEFLNEMGKFNEELIKAGIVLAMDGLLPSSKGARVKFSGKSRTVIDGPFTETKELIAGFWIWKVKNKQEAIEWARRCPHPHPGTDTELEIRQIFEPEDFGPQVAAQERQMLKKIKK